MSSSQESVESIVSSAEQSQPERWWQSWRDAVVYRCMIWKYQMKDRWEYRNKPISPDLYAVGGNMYDYSQFPKPHDFSEAYFEMPVMDVFLQSLGTANPGEAVLDLGSGVGIESDFMQRNLPHLNIVSMDLSTEGAQEGKARGLQQIQAKAPHLPFADESFVGIHSKDVFVHIKNKREFFRQVSRVLVPGGIFCLVTADAMPTAVSTQYKWRAKDLLKHAYRNGLEMVTYDDQPLVREDWYKTLDVPRLFVLFQKVTS